MDDTMSTRRQWITNDKPSVGDVLLEYPVFRFQRWVSWQISQWHCKFTEAFMDRFEESLKI